MITTFGIRHHGPGSARSLMQALRNMAPDCILVEAPQDAESQLSYINHPGLEPPVALLIYNQKELRQASYYPFAGFSPEWQAIRYGLAKKIPVRLMDLPMAIQFDIEEQDRKERQIAIDLTDQDNNKTGQIARDPLGYMAGLAGYTDSERWWETFFETEENDERIFDAILELITALRSGLQREESRMTLLREAHMRKVIRKAVKDKFERIAVICGAWHAPVLHDFATFKQSADNALLRGFNKKKTATTWIPWSYDRLAFQSGYGAGVLSPAWYELLFSHRKEVVIRWMAQVAELFRKEQMDASSAHVLEAVRLANTLATLRQKSIPGMDELQEAAISVFSEGREEQLALIRDELVIGRKAGKVPPEIPAVPLQRDLEAQIKSARLTKYWGETGKQFLKATAKNERGGIDLRNEADLLKSHLLHRLNILDIPWGTAYETSENDLGAFKEIWQLDWKPDFAIRIIEAGMWGNTVYNAAIHFVHKQAADSDRLSDITAWVREALRADLIPLIDPLIRKLQQLTALEKDVYHLMDALPGLVAIIRYGDTRKTDTRSVEKLAAQLIPRIAVGLPGACFNIDEEVARELFKKVLAAHHAIGIYDREDQYQSWYESLDRIAGSRAANELLQGACTRLLFDKGIYDLPATTTRLHYGLSAGHEVMSVALWIEGFLHGSGLLLLYNPELWSLLDDWVDSLPMDTFETVLPMLRRTFANFSPPERQRMLEQAVGGTQARSQTKGSTEHLELDEDRMAIVGPAIRKLLGLIE